MTSFYRGGHQKVTLGDMGGGRGQKSQKRGDVLCERPLRVNLEKISQLWCVEALDFVLFGPFFQC